MKTNAFWVSCLKTGKLVPNEGGNLSSLISGSTLEENQGKKSLSSPRQGNLTQPGSDKGALEYTFSLEAVWLQLHSFETLDTPRHTPRSTQNALQHGP